MTVLHITNWYPSALNPNSALWIKQHIDSLSKYSDNEVIHFQILKGRFALKEGRNEDNSSFLIIHIPFELWTLYELISLIMIGRVLFKGRKKKYDIINFHIAYPNCTYLHVIRKFFRYPVVITEHWSAYHYDFNISNSRKRKKIQRIFRQNIPVITVSKALKEDIKHFSKTDFPCYVIPNIVDTSLFYNHKINKESRDLRFLMISQWKWPKDPFTVIKAWARVIEDFPNAKLSIGGYGPQVADMTQLIKEMHLDPWILFIGKLTSEQTAEEMSRALALIHCSEYETFSVVCAEALCCGIPVIASKVGGIPEFVHANNGILVLGNSPAAFASSILDFIRVNHFIPEEISKEATDKFSKDKIGGEYYSVLKKIISQ